MHDNKNLHVVSYAYLDNPIKFSINGKVTVNATQMAKPFGKQSIDWLKTQQSKDFLDVFSKLKKISLADLVQVRKGGSNPGTWMHEDVALEFARWLSPEFAIWCNDRIKEILLGNLQKAEVKQVKYRYQNQKVDTYLTPDEAVQLQQISKKLGYASVHQLLQVLVQGVIDGSSHIHEVKTLKDEVKWWKDMLKISQSTNDTLHFIIDDKSKMINDLFTLIDEERTRRKDAEKKLKLIQATLV